MKKTLTFLVCLIFVFCLKAQTARDSTVLYMNVVDPDLVPESDAVVSVYTEPGKKLYAVDTTNVDGDVVMRIRAGRKYRMVIEKFDTLFDMGVLTVPEEGFKALYKQRLKIKYIVKDYLETYELHVHFKTNEHELDLEDLHVLSALYQKMKDNNVMRIEIAAHTDNVGHDKYNMRLSQRRADAVRDYLLGEGIDPSRIVSKGYGETQPLADNNTEEGRAKNRRVEVRVIKL